MFLDEKTLAVHLTASIVERMKTGGRCLDPPRLKPAKLSAWPDFWTQ
jgi:hypothetical protein